MQTISTLLRLLFVFLPAEFFVRRLVDSQTRERQREGNPHSINIAYLHPKFWLLSDIFIYFHGISGHFCCHHLKPPDLCQVRRASLQVLGQLQVKSKALVRRPIVQGDAAMGCGANVGVLVLVGWSGLGFFVFFCFHCFRLFHLECGVTPRLEPSRARSRKFRAAS